MPWPIKKMGDVCEIYQPQIITSKEILKEGPFRVFGANGAIGFYKKYNHDNSEVIIGCRGTCGSIYFTEPKTWITGNSMVVRPKINDLLKKFLFYQLQIINLSKAITGSSQPQITRATLSPVEIFLPPVEIQKRIIERLDKISEAQRLNKELIKKSDELFQSLLHKELNPVGKNWEVKKLLDLAELITKGTTPTTYGHQFTKSGTPFLRAEDVINDGVNYLNVQYHISEETNKFLNRSRTKANDILITIAGTIGRIGYIPKDAPEMNMNQAVAIVRLKRFVDFMYIFFLLQNGHLQKKMFGAQVIGTITNLSLTNIGNIKISFPPLKIQKQIIARLSVIHDYKKQLLEQKLKLKELFDSVLNKSLNN